MAIKDGLDSDKGFMHSADTFIGKKFRDYTVTDFKRVEIRFRKVHGELIRYRERIYECTCNHNNQHKFERSLYIVKHNPNKPGCECGRISQKIARREKVAKTHIGEMIGGCKCVGYSAEGKQVKYNYICPFCNTTFSRRRSYMVEASLEYPNRNISCGCRESANRVQGALNGKRSTGGLSKHPLYRHWLSMIDRCESHTSDVTSARYGNREVNPIRVCAEWYQPGKIRSSGCEQFANFMEWSINNGWKPQCDMQLDRINNNANYSPENCKWTNRISQMSNRSVSVRVEYMRQVYTYSEFERKYNLPTCILTHLRRKRTQQDCDIYIYEHAHPHIKLHVDASGIIKDQHGNIRMVPKVLFFPLYPDDINDKVRCYDDYCKRKAENVLLGIPTR